MPLNLAGDFGGGAYLAIGVFAAVIDARTSGQGEVVDAAMVDGAASLMASAYPMHAGGMQSDGWGTMPIGASLQTDPVRDPGAAVLAGCHTAPEAGGLRRRARRDRPPFEQGTVA